MISHAEIEKALDALPAPDQKALMLRLGRNLSRVPGSSLGRMPAPPDVPIEELKRIHALIEAEFSQIDPAGWK